MRGVDVAMLTEALGPCGVRDLGDGLQWLAATLAAPRLTCLLADHALELMGRCVMRECDTTGGLTPEGSSIEEIAPAVNSNPSSHGPALMVLLAGPWHGYWRNG